MRTVAVVMSEPVTMVLLVINGVLGGLLIAALLERSAD